jgi:nicotinate-nucleotide adenylyltransferase
MVKSAANQARWPLVGILGGTFDPIHHGHLRMAEDLADILKFDALRFIPSANPPHKQSPTTSAEDRCEMVKLAIASNPRFILDDRELKREGASYTIDTLLSLRQELGEEVALCLIMGSDAFAEFDSWHRWREILSLCHLVLVERPHIGLTEALRPALQTLLRDRYTEQAAQLPGSASGLITIQRITTLDISATGLRSHMASGRSIRYLLPDAVMSYIEANKLYQQ